MPQTPLSICLLRLSALGDVTHVVPLVRTLQAAWPEVALTWVIGKGEHRLLEGLPGVVFVEYDKRTGLAGMRALRGQLLGQLADGRFDALLQMQVAARANLLSAFVPATRRIAVLGVMAELDDPAAGHRAIAEQAARLGIELIAVGTHRYGVAPVADPVAAVGRIGAGTAVVVKASLVGGLQAVAAELLARHQR